MKSSVVSATRAVVVDRDRAAVVSGANCGRDRESRSPSAIVTRPRRFRCRASRSRTLLVESSATVKTSSWATGGSLELVTVTVTVAVSVPPFPSVDRVGEGLGRRRSRRAGLYSMKSSVVSPPGSVVVDRDRAAVIRVAPTAVTESGSPSAIVCRCRFRCRASRSRTLLVESSATVKLRRPGPPAGRWNSCSR